MSKTLVVVGGGITGLVAARRARLADGALDIVLVERDERLGGKVRTHELAGVPIEAGADWFLTRQPAALELCRELGLDDRLVTPARSGAYIWSKDRLRKIPEGLVRGVPAKPVAAVKAGLLSPAGAARAARELAHREPLSGPDISVGALVRARFGDEVMERLVDPMLAASRSGRGDEMSLAAAAPELDAAARSNPSLLRALRASRPSSDGEPPFLGLRGGMSALVDALHKELDDVEVRAGLTVTKIEKGERFRIVTDRDAIEADAVLLAVPADAAARLVRGLDKDLADELGKIVYAPATVVSLVYPAGAGRPPAEGSGLLVPSGENRLMTACAWFSEKWEHSRPHDGSLIVRCFVGREGTSPLDDDDLVAALSRELREALHLAGPPIDSHVTRWGAALPVYRVGHLDLVEVIERRLEALPGLLIAGAGYRGSGIPDCISQGRGAAEVATAYLRSSGN